MEQTKRTAPASLPELLDAVEALLWKLNRKVSPSGDGSDCEWAKIDRNDVTVRDLHNHYTSARVGQ